MVKLSDVFEFQGKSGIKAGDGLKIGKHPFYTSSGEQSKYLNDFGLQGDSLIFGTGGDASVHFNDGKFSVSTDCLVAQPKDSKKSVTKYYYYFLKGNIRILERGFKGAGLKHISKGYISQINLPDADYQNQKKVVEILDYADALRQKRKESLTLLDEFLRAMFLRMFGDPIFDLRWPMVNFGDVIEILSDYHANGSYEILRDHVRLLSKEDYALMVRTTDLENNEFVKDVNYITKEAYEFLEKSKVFGGEIIINKIGSAGNVYLMPNLNRPVSLGMNAFLLRFKPRANSIFIYYLLLSSYGEKIIKQKIKGAVTKTIRKDAVRSLKIPLPPLGLQEKFAYTVEKINDAKQKMQQSMIGMDNQFNALTQRYF